MDRERIIQNLKYEIEKHKNDRVDTFATNISVMCKDILDYLENERAEDYISRKEVREFVNFVQSIKDNHNEQGKPINYGTICDIVIRAHRLLDLPSLTPTRKKGKWIKDYDNSALDGLYHCSVCGRKLWIPKKGFISDYPYCHCGAKMTESEDNK